MHTLLTQKADSVPTPNLTLQPNYTVLGALARMFAGSVEDRYLCEKILVIYAFLYSTGYLLNSFSDGEGFCISEYK